MQTFRATDGVEIHYRVFGEASAGFPVVLQHGFGASGKLNWVDPGIVSALTDAGRTVVTVDARGHGRSGKPRAPALYGEPTMARDLGQLADLLGLSRYDLVGYSMGAIVSLLVAAKDPRVQRLVVAGVGAGAVELGGVDTRVLPTTTLVEALEAEDPGAVVDPAAAEFRAFVDLFGADRGALAAHARNVHRGPIGFDRIRAKCLVLAGDADPLSARPEVLAAALPGAALRKVRGGHFDALLDPRFRDAIVGFLSDPPEKPRAAFDSSPRHSLDSLA